MKKQSKTVAFVIIIAIISFNIYDFIKAKKNNKESDIKSCMTKFIQKNSVSESVARKYCDCALESVGTKYKNSKLSANQIRENEKELLQSCYNQAISAEKK